MKIFNKLKPRAGFSYLLHTGYSAILPFVIFIFVRIGFSYLGFLFIVISKWRMFAVRPRYWLANIRANGVDIIVSLSLLEFMVRTDSAPWQLLWVIVYAVWLTVVKPGSSSLFVSLQAFIGQSLGLAAIFLWLGGEPLFLLIIAAWLVCYLSSRHFFTYFDEPFSSFYAHSWGYFGAALTWVLGHWLLFYGVIAQPVLILGAVGLGLGSLYFLHQGEKLNKQLKRQIVFISVAIVVVIIVFSNWSGRIV